MEEKNEEELEQRKTKIKKSLFSWVTDNYDKAFLIILGIAFIIRFLIFLKTLDQALWYDAAHYLATAKKWGLGLGVKDIWYHRRGAFWPLFGALLFKIGLGESALRFFVLLFSTGIVAVSYFLIKEMFNKKLALLTSLCMCFSWVLLFFTGRPLTSTPATFFLLTSLLFFWKGYAKNQGKKFIWLFGLFYALAVFTRMQYAMFAVPFIIFAFTKEKFKFLKNKHLWIAVAIFCLFLIPHFTNQYMHFGNPVKDLLAHYFGIGFEGAASTTPRTFSTIFDYFKDLPYGLTKPLFLLFIMGVFYFFIDLILGFDKIFKNKEIQKKLFILFWIITPFFILGYITQYVEQRYYMQTLPFLYAIACIPPLRIGNLLIKNTKITKKLATVLIFIILAILLVYPNLSFLQNTKSNLTWANELIEAKKPSYLPVKQAGLWIKEHSEPNDLVISASIPQIIYYAERTTYSLNELSDLDNESFFTENIEKLKPRYLVLSRFEEHKQWMYEYPLKYQDKLTPVQSYMQQDNQPVLIIYEFNYNNKEREEMVIEYAQP